MRKLYLLVVFACFAILLPDVNAQTSSSASLLNDSAPTLKRKVAIARFSNETQSGTSFLVDDSGDRLGKQASDILSSKLSATGKFMMFERSDKDDIDSEKIISGLKEEGVGVDYLIIGSVSEFGRSVGSESKVFSRSKTQRAYGH